MRLIADDTEIRPNGLHVKCFWVETKTGETMNRYIAAFQDLISQEDEDTIEAVKLSMCGWDCEYGETTSVFVYAFRDQIVEKTQDLKRLHKAAKKIALKK